MRRRRPEAVDKEARGCGGGEAGGCGQRRRRRKRRRRRPRLRSVGQQQLQGSLCLCGFADPFRSPGPRARPQAGCEHQGPNPTGAASPTGTALTHPPLGLPAAGPLLPPVHPCSGPSCPLHGEVSRGPPRPPTAAQAPLPTSPQAARPPQDPTLCLALRAAHKACGATWDGSFLRGFSSRDSEPGAEPWRLRGSEARPLPPDSSHPRVGTDEYTQGTGRPGWGREARDAESRGHKEPSVIWAGRPGTLMLGHGTARGEQGEEQGQGALGWKQQVQRPCGRGKLRTSKEACSPGSSTDGRVSHSD